MNLLEVDTLQQAVEKIKSSLSEIGFETEYLYAMSKPLPKYYADNVKHDMVAEEVHRG